MMKQEKNKRNKEEKSNRIKFYVSGKNLWFYLSGIAIFLFLGAITLAMSGAIIYEILNPPKPVTPLSTFGLLSLFVIMLGISFIIHGFHPILLVKVRK